MIGTDEMTVEMQRKKGRKERSEYSLYQPSLASMKTIYLIHLIKCLSKCIHFIVIKKSRCHRNLLVSM